MQKARGRPRRASTFPPYFRPARARVGLCRGTRTRTSTVLVDTVLVRYGTRVPYFELIFNELPTNKRSSRSSFAVLSAPILGISPGLPCWISPAPIPGLQYAYEYNKYLYRTVRVSWGYSYVFGLGCASSSSLFLPVQDSEVTHIYHVRAYEYRTYCIPLFGFF